MTVLSLSQNYKVPYFLSEVLHVRSNAKHMKETNNLVKKESLDRTNNKNKRHKSL